MGKLTFQILSLNSAGFYGTFQFLWKWLLSVEVGGGGLNARDNGGMYSQTDSTDAVPQDRQRVDS